jgi:peptidoglycan hydrolase-like protein with peptidoglycan-binding domain
VATPTPPAPAPPKPAEYWNDTGLNLAKGAIDNKFAKARKRTADAPHDYVSDLQKDLVELGYLKAGSDDGSYGAGTERAVKRFQRHARRNFRMHNKTKVPGIAWAGAVTGICDPSTAKEIRTWIDKQYQVPVGVFKIEKIKGGNLREDVAELWQAALDDVSAKGGSLLPVGKLEKEFYSDTWRNPKNGFKHTGGNSKLSLHYSGRAIDLSMQPAGGKGQRWWVAKEAADGRTYWRIYCKTEKQDGSQGTKIAAKSKQYYVFYKNTGEKWIPEGYYIDLTSILLTHRFERIPAQKGWEQVAKKLEWWHFFYAKDLQESFLDEMELIGYGEAQLVKLGWTTTDLDKAAG